MPDPQPTRRAAGSSTLTERALAPDLGRGVMLALIAVANVMIYLVDRPSGYRQHIIEAGVADRVVSTLVVTLVDGRAFPLFAFLFGYGIVQLARHTEAGEVRRVLRRRNLGLIVIGAVHGVLLFSGDILGWYGLVGLLVAALLGRTDRTLLALGALWVVPASVVVGLIYSQPSADGGRGFPMAVYFAGLVTLSLVLSSHAEPFSILVIGCFPMAFVALRGGWAYVGVGVVCLCLLITVGGTRSGLDLIVQVVGAGALAAAVGWAIRRIESEAVQRREAHTELAELNARLQRATREKEELQQHLIEAARKAGVAAERARLARDFHDTLAQGLAAIGSQLETAEEQIDDEQPGRARVRTALRLSRSCLAEARRSVNALRPGPLEADDLLGALRSTVASWQERTGVKCQLTVTGTPVAVDPARQTAVLRIVQEGLTNVARHAHAVQATVTVSYLDDRVMIDVFDDGAGFDPTVPMPPGAEGGYGLSAARERLNQVGGWLAVDSAPGAGVTLTATVPVTGRLADPAVGSAS